MHVEKVFLKEKDLPFRLKKYRSKTKLEIHKLEMRSVIARLFIYFLMETEVLFNR